MSRPVTIEPTSAQQRAMRELAEVLGAPDAVSARDLELIRERIEGDEALVELHDALRTVVEQDGIAVCRDVPVESAMLLVGLMLAFGEPVSVANGGVVQSVRVRPPEQRYDVSTTAEAFPLHTDTTGFAIPPDAVCYACLERTPDAGGETTYLHLAELLERLRRNGHGDAVDDLHAPVYPFAIQDPILDGRGPAIAREGGQPMRTDGERRFPILVARPDAALPAIRYRLETIERGFGLADEALPERYARALSALTEVVEQPGAGHQFVLNPGEAMFIDNTCVLHGRTAVNPDARRELRRLRATRSPELLAIERRLAVNALLR
jgi:alpha-ketoglutarate-dependent taurine dioxygenase